MDTLNRVIVVIFILVVNGLIIGCAPEPITLRSKHPVDLKSNVASARFSGDHSVLIFLDDMQNIKLWSSQDQDVVMPFAKEHFPDPIRFVDVSFDGQVALLYGEFDVVLFRVENSEYIGKMRFQGISPLARITSAVLSKNKLKLVVGMEDGTINMAELDTGINHQFQPHRQKVTQLLMNQNGGEILSGSLDGQIAKWRFAEPKAVYSQLFQHRITSLAFNDNQSKLFVSDGLREQQVLHAETGDMLLKLDYLSRFKPFREAVFSHDDRFLVTSATKSQLTFWDLNSGTELGVWHITANKESTTVVALSINEAHELVSISSEGLIEFWSFSPLEKRLHKE
ncbi:hypothetical protein PALB_9850 [Pseudoalteromonas luteoviolacea B = ATCC 29581]|nr:hypothetical protein PALB_9850 [Pseudoalteromonas luteoviolacea B = ATCC 29581]